MRAQVSASPTPTSSSAGAAAPGTPISPAQIVDKNNLQLSGNPPFHAKLAFQLFTLDGKPAEEGTVEYWWTDAKKSRMQIVSPTIGTVESANFDTGTTPAAKRNLYLVNALIDNFLSPGDVLGPPQETIDTREQTLADSRLLCMKRRMWAPSGAPQEVCADPRTGAIRLLRSVSQGAVRNHTGLFG